MPDLTGPDDLDIMCLGCFGRDFTTCFEGEFYWLRCDGCGRKTPLAKGTGFESVRPGGVSEGVHTGVHEAEKSEGKGGAVKRGRPVTVGTPWVDLGISRSAWYRERAKGESGFFRSKRAEVLGEKEWKAIMRIDGGTTMESEK